MDAVLLDIHKIFVGVAVHRVVSVHVIQEDTAITVAVGVLVVAATEFVGRVLGKVQLLSRTRTLSAS